MSQDALDMDLQDYVDDRMTDERRRAFEDRLARDPGLARRVLAHRQSAEALRGGPAGLSPDFHVRLRERFEEQSRARSPRWFRLASWEAAGLAAAAILAGVLFVPLFLDRDAAPTAPLVPLGRLDPDGSATVERPGESSLDEKTDKQAPAVDRLEPKRQTVGRSVAGDVESRKDAASADRDAAQEGFAPVPPEVAVGGAKIEKSKSAKEDAPAMAPASSAPARELLDEREGARPAPEPLATADEPMAAARSRSNVQLSVSGVRVRAGLVEPGAWVEIDSPAEWQNLSDGLERDDLGDHDESRRVVVVGQRGGGLDCGASRVIEAGGAYEVHLVRQAADGPPDEHGCAFVLPRDGRPIRVLEPGER